MQHELNAHPHRARLRQPAPFGPLLLALVTPRSIRVKQSAHVPVPSANPIDDDQRDARREIRSGLLRLSIVTIVATPLNSGDEEKAAAVRSHGAKPAVNVLVGRYRHICRRRRVHVAGSPRLRVYINGARCYSLAIAAVWVLSLGHDAVQ